MEIKKSINGNEVVLECIGRLDTTTAPEMEKIVNEVVPVTNSLILDFQKIEYVSSAGLRVLLMTQKNMVAKNGKLVIKHVADEVMEVFDMTGFSSFLTIED